MEAIKTESEKEKEATSASLIPVTPIVSIEEAVNNWKHFIDLKKSLLDEQDYQGVKGRTYIKKSGWRKLAAVFNLSDIVTKSWKEIEEDKINFTQFIEVMVTAPNGRTSTGVAGCSSKERKFAHLEHDIYATAHTRAKNRAISDMVGGGEVSYEEIEGFERGKETINEPEEEKIRKWKQKHGGA